MTTNLQAGPVAQGNGASEQLLRLQARLQSRTSTRLFARVRHPRRLRSPCAANEDSGVFAEAEVPDPKPFVKLDQSVDVRSSSASS